MPALPRVLLSHVSEGGLGHPTHDEPILYGGLATSLRGPTKPRQRDPLSAGSQRLSSSALTGSRTDGKTAWLRTASKEPFSTERECAGTLRGRASCRPCSLSLAAHLWCVQTAAL